MSILISCPTCRQHVTVIADGFVREHLVNGTLCSFTRTSRTTTQPMPQLTADEKKAAEAAKRRKRVIRKEQKAMEAVRNPPPNKPVLYICGICGRKVTGKPDQLAAHGNPETNRWCKGGATPKKPKGGKAKRSVWTVAGGLPGLGKR
jgi:hypothetical protein